MVALVILFVLCLILGAGLIHRYSIALQDGEHYVGMIKQLSQAWHDARLKLNEQKRASVSLERDLSRAIEGAESYSNKVAKVSADPARTSLARDPMIALPQPDLKVAKLLDERDGLNPKLKDLTSALTKLDREKAEVQRKLDHSEGDRDALLRHLKWFQADQTKLMRQFNDIALLREQLRQLKAEQSISRRLEWIRHAVYGSYKGAELLRNGVASATPASANYDLNVEIRRNEGARELPAGR
jgi:hypothetical protein